LYIDIRLSQAGTGIMLRRVVSWAFRQSRDAAIDAALRFGRRSAVDTALGVAAEAVPVTSPRSLTQVFNVKPPITVYVRASHCRVTVRRAAAPRVTLEANLYRAFGVDLAAEQDDAGVYIVAKRKPVMGTVSRTDFTITVPSECHLAFRLTPGDVVFEDINGIMELPANQVFAPPETQST
jgi:hypothetical protein